ncbi:MAG: 4Fe-4S ferredoxin [Staphylothermus sp.]|nr:4Fe-4S ferredoxin [Staphylothermus sp.]
MYKCPRLIDINAKSKIFRNNEKLLIIGRCIEIEHPDILEEFIKQGYSVLSVCLEAEHVNMVGFKLAGVIARGNYKEVSVLTVDGSMHCTQLHWMLEEVFKILGRNNIIRRHFVIYKGKLFEVSTRSVKTSRYLYKVDKIICGGTVIDDRNKNS